jgi:hypothetical protein
MTVSDKSKVNAELIQNYFILLRDIIALTPQGDLQLFHSLQHFLTSVGMTPQADYLKRIKKLSRQEQELLGRACSRGQVASKLWLVEKLRQHVDLEGVDVVILGGWVGTLSAMMFWLHPSLSFRVWSLDLDERSSTVAAKINHLYSLNGDRFFASIDNMLEISYSEPVVRPLIHNRTINFNPSVIINTSCEHLFDVAAWASLIPNGKTVVAQSNNFFSCREHKNCISSVDEFVNQLSLKTILFSGELILNDYTRFMVIGKK